MINKGFTLIEVVIYLALFGVLIGGVLTAAYQIIVSETSNQTTNTITQDGIFIKAKIDWAVSGATSIYTTGDTLVVNRPDLGTLIFSEEAGNVTLKYNSDPALPLNNERLNVSNLNFTVTATTVTTALTINQKTFTHYLNY